MKYLYESLDKPTRLYIKKCSHCELKYFGKTVREDIEDYSGSGLRWNNHLKKHNAHSIHLWNSDWYYDTSISKFALKFSAINCIVESNTWANIIPENGINGGGNCNQMHTPEIREKIKETCLIKYGTDCVLKSPEIRNKANNSILLKYGKSRGQVLTNNKSIKKRNKTNEKRYGNACAANKDGNKKSKATQEKLNQRKIVKIIKCVSAFSPKKLNKGWWYKENDELNEILDEILNHIQFAAPKTTREKMLSRKKVRLLILLNRLVVLGLGQNWFQKKDNEIDILFTNLTEAHPEFFDIALQSYHLIFQESL